MEGSLQTRSHYWAAGQRWPEFDWQEPPIIKVDDDFLRVEPAAITIEEMDRRQPISSAAFWNKAEGAPVLRQLGYTNQKAADALGISLDRAKKA